MGGNNLSDGICALGAIIVSPRLPHAANGRFNAMISCDPVPGFGRPLPDADSTGVHRPVATHFEPLRLAAIGK